MRTLTEKTEAGAGKSKQKTNRQQHAVSVPKEIAGRSDWEAGTRKHPCNDDDLHKP
jgi:hypothetical protein